MSKGSNQKFKLYRLAQIMLVQTDDKHYITVAAAVYISKPTGKSK